MISHRNHGNHRGHDAAPVRPPECYQLSHADFAEDAEIFYQQNLNANLDTNTQKTHTQACAASRMGNASEVMRDSAKVCGVCVRQNKTVESRGIVLIVKFVKSVRFVVK